MIYYGIPTYSQFDRVRSAIDGILEGTVIPDRIIVVDNSETGAGTAALQDLPNTYPSVSLHTRTENVLAGAWNDIMHMAGEDFVIIANDDVIPHKGSIEALINAALDKPDIAMFNGSGHSGNSYSFFLLRQWAYAQVGPFDEKFKPAYFEDNDYDYRLVVLHNLIRTEVPNATFEHFGSATIKAFNKEQGDRHNQRFVKNQRYYLSKWGGMPGQEKYKQAFAGIDLSDL